MLGKPIVTFDTGEQLEKVEDLIFDQDGNQLLGFLVDEGGWFSSARVLLLRDVRAIGLDAIVTSSKDAIVKADQLPEIKPILQRNNVLRGTKIMTTNGRSLGSVVDLFFDEQTGAVEGYEVSGGVFADAYSGRSFVPAPQTLQIGQDVVFVPPEIAEMMEEQVGGIKGRMQTANERLEDSTPTSSELQAGPGETVDPVKQKAFVIGKIADQGVTAPDGTLLIGQGQQVTLPIADLAERQGILDQLYRAAGGSSAGYSRAASSVVGDSVEQARGRRVRRAVRTEAGVFIAAPGQIVTEQVINRAQAYHKEQDLIDAVGLVSGATSSSPNNPTASSQQFGVTTQGAGERLRSGAAQAQAGARNLWEEIKATVSDVQEQRAQAKEEQQIKDALGRPVTRVILDKQDDVILNVGELITHQAIERARQADVLSILLSSVYDQGPTLPEQDLRAPETGSASLEERDQV